VQNTFYYTSGIIQAKHSNNFETWNHMLIDRKLMIKLS
jgi:hypothetical protein